MRHTWLPLINSFGICREKKRTLGRLDITNVVDVCNEKESRCFVFPLRRCTVKLLILNNSIDKNSSGWHSHGCCCSSLWISSSSSSINDCRGGLVITDCFFLFRKKFANWARKVWKSLVTSVVFETCVSAENKRHAIVRIKVYFYVYLMKLFVVSSLIQDNHDHQLIFEILHRHQT